MGQILHGSATTTEAIRRAIQNSEESLRALSKRYGINQKTVAKWKKRTSLADLPTGPKDPHSTILSLEEEAVIIAFRRHTLLALDDCLYALQPTIPHLTRSSLHRCLQRIGSELADRSVDLIEQRLDLRGVAGVLIRERMRNDRATVGIKRQMQFAPATAGRAMLLFQSLAARAVDLQPGAIDRNVG